MAGIRLIVILCVLLISSDSISEFFFTVFLMHLEYLHSKQSVTSNNVLYYPNSTFPFFGCYMVSSTKSGNIEINPGPVLPYALMMKKNKII